MTDPGPQSLLSALARAPRDRGIRFTRAAGGEVYLSYRALRSKALRLLAALVARGLSPGDRLVFQIRDVEDFVPLFWACLLGGLVPVPVQVGNRPEHRRKLLNIWLTLERPHLVTDLEEGPALPPGEGPEADVLPAELERKMLRLGDLPDSGPEADVVTVGADDVAFLQFSSGSTGDPTGVVLTHGNLVSHLRSFAGVLEITQDDSFLSWFPLTHDMGLIGWHLMPAYCGVDQTLMPTGLFVRRPTRWMSEASALSASVLCSPNFGLKHFLKLFKPETARGWNLSAVRLLVNGAEQISAKLCDEFLRALEPFGLRRSVMTPGYGLAEATLAVSCAVARPGEEFALHRVDRRSVGIGDRLRPAEEPRHAVEFVDLGHPIPGTEVRVVDSDGRVLGEKRVGVVEVRGPSVAARHLRRQAVDRAPGNGDGWVSTGDLGFLQDGRLVITGRLKDLIVLHGFNYFPHDIERVCEELDGVELGKIVARGVRRPGSDEEELALFVYFKGALSDFAALGARLREQVLQRVGLVVGHVIPVRSIPKTTSGKIRGFELAQDFEQGRFDEVLAELEALAGPAQGFVELEALPDVRRRPRLLRLLREEASGLLEGEPELERPLFEQGLDSIRAVEFTRRIGSRLGVDLADTLIFEHPTLLDVADHILGIAGRAGGPRVRRAAGDDGIGLQDDSVAIVGLGCRFPGGVEEPAGYWRVLADGVSTIGEVPRDRWRLDGEMHGELEEGQRRSTEFGAFLQRVDGFDHHFFRISPREAESLDPQARLLLEVCWEALEHSGHDVPALAGHECGVFVGISNADYSRAHFHSGDASKIDTYSYTGTAFSTTAGRISHLFGFQGPALAIDTACSSSLVAVHLAVQALASGDCTLAVAGGVNLMLSPEPHLSLATMGALAPDGRCRAFDDEASGYVRGEGCGLVVLKRLSEAMRDGDRVLAVVRGSAVNHDGSSSGLTVPNGMAQQRVIRKALQRAGVEPAEVDFVETHGTGTPLGDPIELGALDAVFGGRRERKLWAGAVKSNLGHLESAAGIAGLIKVVLSLWHERIPKNLHFSRPSRRIPWDRIGIRIPVGTETWDRAERPRVAGVSSFGFSGTNAHVVVAEAPAEVGASGRAEPAAALPEPGLYPLSARSPEALREVARRHAAFLRHRPPGELYDSAWTAAVRRSHLDRRGVCRFRSSSELLGQLDALAGGRPMEGLEVGRKPVTAAARVAFVLSGQGGQWSGMGRRLVESEPIFKASLERSDRLLRSFASWSLLEELERDPRASRLHHTAIAQPAIFALQVGLVELLGHYGVEPEGLVGHSCGEVTAAWAAGRLTLEDAVEVIYRRALLMEPAAGRGRMCAVQLAAGEAGRFIEPYRDRVAIAAVNAPRMTVLAGDTSALEEVVERLAAEGVQHKRLEVDYAFHSHQMDDAAARIAEQLASLRPLDGGLPIYSTVSGGLAGGDGFDAGYWSRNVRQPVRFADAIAEMVADGFTHFVEISPHPHLVWPIHQCLEERGSDGREGAGSIAVVPTLHRDRDCRDEVARALGELYCHGLDLEWGRIYRVRGRLVDLPAYPWQRQRAWKEDWSPGRSVAPAVASAVAGQDAVPPDRLFMTEWQEADGRTAVPVAARTGPWVVVAAEDGEPTAAVCRHLENAGLELVRASLRGGLAAENGGGRASLEKVFAELATAGKSPCGVLFLGLCEPGGEEPALERLMAAQEAGALAVARLVRTLSGVVADPAPGLWLITNGTQRLPTDEAPVNLPYASLWGLGRVVGIEHPELGCRRIDLSPRPSAPEIRRLAALLASPDLEESELSLRGSDRTWCSRLSHPTRSPRPRPPLRIEPDACYLISGGYGGLGLEVARWLAERGARNLVLVGRQGPGPRGRERIAALAEGGVRVEVVRADVSSPADVGAALRRVDAEMPPLKGVVHAAGVLHDAVLHRIERDDYLEVVAPKVAGGWNLHVATRERDLDFFVAISSIAALLGSPGQGSYVAGNSFLDALADYRQTRGLPSLSFGLGGVAGTGMSAASEVVRRQIGDAGVEPLTADECLGGLPAAWRQGFSRLGLMQFDVARWMEQYPVRAQRSYLSRLAPGGPAAAPRGGSLLGRLSRLTSEKEILRAVEAELVSMLAAALKLPPEKVDPGETFRDMGLDSMMAVRIRVQLEERFSVLVPITSFWTYQTIDKFSRYLCQATGLTDRFRTVGAGAAERIAEESSVVSLDRVQADLDSKIKRYL